MKTEQVQKVLEAEASVKAESKGVYSIGEEVELTVLLDMGQEPLSVARVRKLTLSGDLTTVETHKGERIYTSAPLRALKFAAVDAVKRGGAGFTR